MYDISHLFDYYILLSISCLGGFTTSTLLYKIEISVWYAVAFMAVAEVG